jgi:hypothetical protein
MGSEISDGFSSRGWGCRIGANSLSVERRAYTEY